MFLSGCSVTAEHTGRNIPFPWHFIPVLWTLGLTFIGFSLVFRGKRAQKSGGSWPLHERVRGKPKSVQMSPKS